MTSSDLRVRAPESLRVLSNQAPFADVEIEIQEKIGQLEADEKKALEEILLKIMQADKSHLITGVYTISNIEDRPDNTYIFIGQPSIILNVAADQVLIIEHEAPEAECHLVRDLILQLGEVFVFASGNGITDALTELDYSNRSDNIVFDLVDFDMEALDRFAEEFNYVQLHETDAFDEETLAGFAMAIWDYDLETFRSRDNPHVVALNEDNQPMGGARANAVTDDYAVIGGVYTLPVFRKQGVGKGVSQILSGLLLKQGKQVVLETDDENYPALKIYHDLGFKEVGNSIFLDFGTSMIDKIRGDRDY